MSFCWVARPANTWRCKTFDSHRPDLSSDFRSTNHPSNGRELTIASAQSFSQLLYRSYRGARDRNEPNTHRMRRHGAMILDNMLPRISQVRPTEWLRVNDNPNSRGSATCSVSQIRSFRECLCHRHNAFSKPAGTRETSLGCTIAAESSVVTKVFENFHHRPI